MNIPIKFKIHASAPPPPQGPTSLLPTASGVMHWDVFLRKLHHVSTGIMRVGGGGRMVEINLHHAQD